MVAEVLVTLVPSAFIFVTPTTATTTRASDQGAEGDAQAMGEPQVVEAGHGSPGRGLDGRPGGALTCPRIGTARHRFEWWYA